MLRISSSIIKSFIPCHPDKIQREKKTCPGDTIKRMVGPRDSGLTNGHVAVFPCTVVKDSGSPPLSINCMSFDKLTPGLSGYPLSSLFPWKSAHTKLYPDEKILANHNPRFSFVYFGKNIISLLSLLTLCDQIWKLPSKNGNCFSKKIVGWWE